MTPDTPSGKSVRQAVVLCGGKGTRLRSITGDALPKVMIDVCGRPLLEYHVELLRRHGIDDVILCTGYLSEVIERHFGDGERFGVRLRYAREPQALGTAGALVQVPFDLSDEFFVLYADVFANVDLRRMAAYHCQKGGEATLLVHSSEHPYDSDLVVADTETGRITGFPGRPKPGEPFVNLTSAALYVVNRSVAPHIPRDRSTDLARDIFPARRKAGAALYAYLSEEYLHDMGTPERYARVVRDVRRMIEQRAGSLFGP